MVASLYIWDKNQNPRGSYYDWDYYYAMAFGGLYYVKTDSNGNVLKDSNNNPIYVETDSFKAIIPSEIERNKIKNILINESHGRSSALGKKCN